MLLLSLMSDTNKLQVNVSKTKELARHFTVPPLLPFIEHVAVNKLFGIYISVTFSAAAPVEHILYVANQRMYLLTQLKSQGLSRNALHIILTTVLSVVTCALPFLRAAVKRRYARMILQV